MNPVRPIAAVALALSFGLTLFGTGCGKEDPTSECPPTGACLNLQLDAPAIGPGVLNQIEIVIRTPSGHRSYTDLARTRRLPTVLGVPLPELDEHRGLPLSIYLRATVDRGQAPLHVGAEVHRPSGSTSRADVGVSLEGPCLSSACKTPGERQHATMVYEPRTRRVVLFGGRRGSVDLGDTWEWDGLRWRLINTDNAPSGRYGHGMAYDPHSGRVLVFGGMNSTGSLLGDTWEYVGAPRGWEQIHRNVAPPARGFHAMSTAPVSPSSSELGILVFGGRGDHDETLGDTWLWDGSSWKEAQDVAVPCGDYPADLDPAPRCRTAAAAALVHDPKRGQVALLLGGVIGKSASGTAIYDGAVWRWDGLSWSRAPVAHPPYVLHRSMHRLVTAPGETAGAGSRVLLTGGESHGTLLKDAYILDLSEGLFTTQLGAAPAGRSGAAIALDEERGEVVMAGGRSDKGEVDETWTFREAQGWTYRR